MDIPGQMFNPVFMTEADFEEGYKNSVFYVEKDYLQEYRKHLAALDHIANIAKSYIFNNWQKVEDWSDLDVTVRAGNTGKKTHYYKYVERDRFNTRNVKVAEMFDEMREEEKNNQNPVRVFNSVVLDPTDGDFSVTINDTEHWWINDDAIIIIADYIEEQMKKMNNKKLELLNSEGPILMAEKVEDGYVIWDQWRKGPLMTLSKAELLDFMNGKVEIADSSGKRWNYLNEHPDMKSSQETIDNFFD